MKSFRTILTYIIFLFLTSISNASLTDVIKSTVHIHTPTGQATGIVFGEDDKYLYFLTAGHAVADLDKVRITCHNTGYACHPIFGEFVNKVHEADTYDDLAIGRFEKRKLLTYPKPIISKIASSKYKIKTGDAGCTAGHANGEWVTGRIGRVEEYDDGERFIFGPHAETGRSGSGVFDEKGENLIGISIWSTGVCVPASKIRKYLKEWKLEHLVSEDK